MQTKVSSIEILASVLGRMSPLLSNCLLLYFLPILLNMLTKRLHSSSKLVANLNLHEFSFIIASSILNCVINLSTKLLQLHFTAKINLSSFFLNIDLSIFYLSFAISYFLFNKSSLLASSIMHKSLS